MSRPVTQPSSEQPHVTTSSHQVTPSLSPCLLSSCSPRNIHLSYDLLCIVSLLNINSTLPRCVNGWPQYAICNAVAACNDCNMICFVSECGRVTTGGVAGSVPATAWGHVTVPPHYTHYTAHYTPNTLYSTWSPPELQTNLCEEREVLQSRRRPLLLGLLLVESLFLSSSFYF